jgi:hypothetical protein
LVLDSAMLLVFIAIGLISRNNIEREKKTGVWLSSQWVGMEVQSTPCT